MADLYEKLLERAQRHSSVQVQEFSSLLSVGASADLERILALPRRPLLSEGDPLVEEMSRRLGRPGGSMRLRPIQAQALHELETVGGLLGPIAVGEGKTLICLLAATVLHARKTVLLVPNSLVDQLLERDLAHYGAHFRIPSLRGVAAPESTGELFIVSYSQLSSEKHRYVLLDLQPDLIVCDEAHTLATRQFSSRKKRFREYRRAFPQTRFVFVSGTILRKSFMDICTLGAMALGQQAPVPLAFPVAKEWAAAIDPSFTAIDGGELARFCREGESIRDGVFRRVVETPGVVASAADDGFHGSLTIHERKVKVPKEVKDSIASLHDTWCTPGGEELQDAVEFWRHARELAAGFYYRWIWPRGESSDLRKAWMRARRDWHREVRKYLKDRAGPNMDSPLLLARAAAEGSWHSETYGSWSAVKDQARPETEAVWISDFLIRDIEAWAKKHVGVIWYELDAVGRALADLGLPFYGPSSEPGQASILREKGDRTIVASRAAWGTGWNLQCFHTQLFTTPSTSNEHWQQALGRLHRQGQMADEVTAYVYQHTEDLRAALKKAREYARFVEPMQGRQKLLLATVTF